MFENPLKAKLQRGESILNGWLTIPSAWAAEVMAHAGYDSLTIDLQHGLMHFDAAVAMIQAIATTSVVPLVRPPWDDLSVVMKLLDAGALGVICPMINNRAEAEALVGACRYPPQGYRSHGATRPVITYGEEYLQTANEQVLVFAMIETAEGFRNLEEIAATPGLDGLYVGPSDLSLALGCVPATEPTEPKVLEAIARIRETAQKHGIIPGIHARTAGYVKRAFAEGFRFVNASSDTALLRAASQDLVRSIRT